MTASHQQDGHTLTYREASVPLPMNEKLDLEFAFTTWSDSCQDPYSLNQQCRRRKGHEERDDIGHAAGFGELRRVW